MRVDERSPRVALLLGAILLTGGRVALAVDLSGSLFIASGATDSDSVETETVDQRYTLDLSQQLTDFLRLRLGYQHFDFSSDTEGVDGGQRTQAPQVEVIYSRPRLSGRLSYEDRSISSRSALGDFDAESLVGHLTWQALASTVVTVRYRDETDIVDQGIFGRGTARSFLAIDGTYRRRHWSTAYAFERDEVENRNTGLLIEEDRHQVRLAADRTFLVDRLDLSFSSQIDYRDRRQEMPGSGDLAVPVPAREGLFAIDPSPEVGELESAPALVDGDLSTPAGEDLEIGGAFTFRNLGLDLGFIQPVTRLEISVDALSGPGVVWEVYRSQDNLVWERVPGVTSQWDGALLRYTLMFPQTSDRFFKAVNVSINTETGVRVTELRALRDVEEESFRTEDDATLLRADLAARYRPHERVSTSIALGFREDEGLATTALQQDFRDVHGAARVSVDLPRRLRLDAGYRFVDFENGIEPVVARREEIASTSLTWDPLDTLRASASFVQREESDETELLRATTTGRVAVDAELLPGLYLDSSVELSEIEDRFSGSDRRSLAVRQLVDAELYPGLRVGGGIEYLELETSDGEPLLERTSFDLRTVWRATSWVTLTGDWRIAEDNSLDSVQQSYGITYTPGTRLTLSGFYRDFDDANLRRTRASSLSATYTMTQRCRLFGTLTRSETRLALGSDTEITSFRTGLSYFF